MRINGSAYQTLFTRDEKTLISIGSTVRIWDFNKEKPVEKKRISTLKHPSFIALSSNEELLAISNTSGYIAVIDMNTYQVIVKSSGIKKEGNSVLFCFNDKKILSSDWDGNIFTLDIDSGYINNIAKLPVIQPDIFIGKNGTYGMIFAGNNDIEKGNLCIWELTLFDKMQLNGIKLDKEYWVSSTDTYCADNDKIYFFGESKEYVKLVCIIDLVTKEVDEILNIQDLIDMDNAINFGYNASICVGIDKRFLLLGMENAIVGFDLLKKECIGIYRIENEVIYDLHFFENDSKLLIATDRSISTISFQDFMISEY